MGAKTERAESSVVGRAGDAGYEGVEMPGRVRFIIPTSSSTMIRIDEALDYPLPMHNNCPATYVMHDAVWRETRDYEAML